MIKMTIATDSHGNVLGAIQHAASGREAPANGIQAGVRFGPGVTLRDVNVGPELDMAKVTDAAKFHEALHQHIVRAAP
jgi:hypothetical protein